MADRDLARVVAELAERVERLERSGPDVRAKPVRRARRALGELANADDDAATVVYSGAGPWEDGAVAWRLGRDWDEVLAGATGTAAVFAALGNGTRLRIVAELLRGPVATGDLAARLDWASSGQLFHHLRELLAAGVVYQPVRGTYAIRRQHVVPLLAVLSAAIDIAMPTALEPA